MRRNQGENQEAPRGQQRGQPQGQPAQTPPPAQGQQPQGTPPRGPPPAGQGGAPQQGGPGQQAPGMAAPQAGGAPGPGQQPAGRPAQGAQQGRQPQPGQGGQGVPPMQPPGGQPGGSMGATPGPQTAPGKQAEAGLQAEPGVQPGPGMGRGRTGRQGPRLQPVTVDEIVQTDVVTAEPDTPIATVVAQMAEQDVGSVVVVEDDRPTGVLTDRTICLALEDDPDVGERTAGDLISRDVATGSTDDSVFDTLNILREEQVRRLPIVDEDGALAGMVTLDDFLVLLGGELHNALEVVREQSPRI